MPSPTGAYTHDDYGNRLYDSGVLADLNGASVGSYQQRGGRMRYDYSGGGQDYYDLPPPNGGGRGGSASAANDGYFDFAGGAMAQPARQRAQPIGTALGPNGSLQALHEQLNVGTARGQIMAGGHDYGVVRPTSAQIGSMIQADQQAALQRESRDTQLDQLRMQLAYQAWKQRRDELMQQRQLDQTRDLTRGGWDHDAFMQADQGYRKWGVS